ncbi:Hypothetical_protein [Hexamita inflata]|uniref:Hypothetical_protein n=1 Tax=Hexamita inflata TaxID=28002 RepID=A0AA86NNP7_9EUKA|nr:Hypothetical protein HINF_LOCUS9968 [Hexamita inflata]
MNDQVQKCAKRSTLAGGEMNKYKQIKYEIQLRNAQKRETAIYRKVLEVNINILTLLNFLQLIIIVLVKFINSGKIYIKTYGQLTGNYKLILIICIQVTDTDSQVSHFIKGIGLLQLIYCTLSLKQFYLQLSLSNQQ